MPVNFRNQTGFHIPTQLFHGPNVASPLQRSGIINNPHFNQGGIPGNFRSIAGSPGLRTRLPSTPIYISIPKGTFGPW